MRIVRKIATLLSRLASLVSTPIIEVRYLVPATPPPARAPAGRKAGSRR